MAKLKNAKLNAREQRFVKEYLIDPNATRAAIAAGYSAKTAGAAGSRLLKNVKIRDAIAEAQVKRAQKLDITAERVLQEVARIGFSDVRKMFNEAGQLKAIHELDDDTAAVVASIEVSDRAIPGGEGETERVTKIKAWDKGGALGQLGKHLGLFSDKLVIGDDLGEALDRAWKRVG